MSGTDTHTDPRTEGAANGRRPVDADDVRRLIDHMSPVEAVAKLIAEGMDPDDARAAVDGAVGEAAADEHAKRKAGKFGAPLRASDIKPVAVEWLWQGLIPLGHLTLLYGPEGDGKSTCAAMIAAKATLGTLPGDVGEPVSVEFVAFEDDPASVVRPRLEAAGADLDRVHIHVVDDDPLTLPNDIEAFEAAVADRGSRLVIVDPLSDTLGEGLKDTNNGDVRSAIAPFQRSAARLGAAFVGTAHPNKSQTDATNRVMGSRAWRSVPRSVLLYGRDPDDLDGPTRVLVASKSNLAPKTARTIRTETVAVAGVGEQPRADIAGYSQHTDHDLLAAWAAGASAKAKPPTQVEAAEQMLYRLLEDGGGEIKAATAYAAGEAAGIPEATMRRARQRAGIEAAAGGGGGIWRLPDSGGLGF